MCVGVVLCVAACGSGSGSDSTLVTKNLDSAGGQLEHPAGAVLDVPRDALDEALEVAMEDVALPTRLPDEVEAVGPAFALRPYETTLAVPAELRLPFEREGGDLEDGREFVAMRLDDPNDTTWTELETANLSRDGTALEVRVERFGVFSVGMRVPAQVGAEIDAAGGELEHPAGARLVVPEGALREPVRVEITRLSAAPTRVPDDMERAGPVFSFTPHGQRFEQEVELELPYVEDGARGEGDLRVLRLDDARDTSWEEIAVASVDSERQRVNVRLDSFSVYTVAWLLSSGTGGAQDGGVPVMDGGDIGQAALSVVQTHPLPGSLRAAFDTQVVFTLSSLVDDASVAAGTLLLADDQGREVPGQVSVEADTVVFTPDQALAVGTQYTATLGADVRDLDGVTLLEANTFQFTTAWVDVNGGGWHTLALAADGTVWSWGENFSGSLGDGTEEGPKGPQQVLGPDGVGVLDHVRALAAGNEHSVALRDDGTVWTWGTSLGLGNGQNAADSTTPVQVCAPGELEPCGAFLTDVVAVAADYYQTLALTSDGRVWAWGDNGNDQLGTGGQDTYTPVGVCAPGESVPCENFLSNIVSISAGAFHSMALAADGTVYAWGWNPYGELGDGTKTGAAVPQAVHVDPVTPLSGIAQVEAGTYVSGARHDDGGVYAWGGNYEGQAGDDTTSNRVFAGRVCAPDASAPCATYLDDVRWLEVGYDFMVVLRGDGTVWGWGAGIFGALGIGNYSRSRVPVAAVGPGGDGVMDQVLRLTTTDYYSTFVLRADGTVWGWGWNDNMELAQSTVDACSSRTCSAIPLQIPGLSLF